MLRYKIILLVVVLGAAGLFWYLQVRKSSPEQGLTIVPNAESVQKDTQPNSPQSPYKNFEVSSIPGRAEELQFLAEIPRDWNGEAITANESLNIYNPSRETPTNLEKSEIFIRHFEANSFLTLQTVNILERQAVTINGRPAVRYVIEKKPSAADFPNQPSWRNKRHTVTDIRVSDNNPSVFLVIAQRPELDEAIYQHFLSTLYVSPQ